MKPSLGDQQLYTSTAMPNGAATVKSASFDMGVGTHDDNLADALFRITGPLLNTTQLPDAQTLKFDLIHSDNADLSSSSVIQAAVLTQTGAGGAGAVSASVDLKIPFSTKRYIGYQATKSGSGDASAAKGIGQLLF